MERMCLTEPFNSIKNKIKILNQAFRNFSAEICSHKSEPAELPLGANTHLSDRNLIPAKKEIFQGQIFINESLD